MDYIVFMMPATESCRGTRHVFASLILPPADDALCECGAVTWEQSCAIRLREVMARDQATQRREAEAQDTQGAED